MKKLLCWKCIGAGYTLRIRDLKKITCDKCNGAGYVDRSKP